MSGKQIIFLLFLSNILLIVFIGSMFVAFAEFSEFSELSEFAEISELYEMHDEDEHEFKRQKLQDSFTAEEREYIAYLTENNKKVPIALETDNYPVSFYNHNDNMFEGIAPDLLAQIGELAGIEFEVINDRDATWAEILQMLESGEVALVSQLLISEERKERFIWCDEPFFWSNLALLSSTELPNLNIREITQKTVAVVKGTYYEDIYTRLFHADNNNSNMRLYDSQSLALDALEKGEVELFFSSQYSLLHQLNYRERSDFKINFVFEAKAYTYFGLNKNEEILRSIINKTMKYTPSEPIVRDWNSRVYDYSRSELRSRLSFTVAVLIALCAAVIVITVLAINTAKSRKRIQETSARLEVTLEQVKAASKAKGDFLSAMSHEMRTPMNAIIGMTAIGKKADNLDEKNYALGKIGEASSHLLGVVNDVLDMAKIEANKLELHPARFDFSRFITKVLSVVNFKAHEKRQIISVNIDEDFPKFVTADSQRLAQVIINLLSNAVKFTPEGGKIGLNAALIGENDGVCEIQIEVSDTGIGIDPSQHERLFLMFEQVESGTGREYGGTGLGLVIAKNIVELMEGRIWVESKLGEGARFIFTVKAKRAEKSDDDCNSDSDNQNQNQNQNDSENKNCGEVSAGEFAGKRLLLAEDVEINREILMTILKDSGLIIDCAENGEVALAMLKKAREQNKGYDIVFMDVQMPKMDGLEATRRIREFYQANALNPTVSGVSKTRQRHIPIIAMTANVFKDDIDACIAAGMDDHLGKPLDIEKIFAKLREYLR